MNLFAEIGGYVGLILGYSLFHVAEIITSAIETKVKKMEDENEVKTESYNTKSDKKEISYSTDLEQ